MNEYVVIFEIAWNHLNTQSYYNVLNGATYDCLRNDFCSNYSILTKVIKLQYNVV